MDIPTQDELLTRIEAFLERHDIAETRFGRDAVNNPAFLRGLREGKSPTLDTLNKLKCYMERIDEAAALRAKLDAPLELAEEAEEEQPLPFGTAPVNHTGAFSPTCSRTNARPQPPGASGSSPTSSYSADAA